MLLIAKFEADEAGVVEETLKKVLSVSSAEN